jgi:hypothetical protein
MLFALFTDDTVDKHVAVLFTKRFWHNCIDKCRETLLTAKESISLTHLFQTLQIPTSLSIPIHEILTHDSNIIVSGLTWNSVKEVWYPKDFIAFHLDSIKLQWTHDGYILHETIQKVIDIIGFTPTNASSSIPAESNTAGTIGKNSSMAPTRVNMDGLRSAIMEWIPASTTTALWLDTMVVRTSILHLIESEVESISIQLQSSNTIKKANESAAMDDGGDLYVVDVKSLMPMNATLSDIHALLRQSTLIQKKLNEGLIVCDDRFTVSCAGIQSWYTTLVKPALWKKALVVLRSGKNTSSIAVSKKEVLPDN